jgi:hypothetical protein
MNYTRIFILQLFFYFFFYYLAQDIMNKWPIQSEHLMATLLHPRLRDFSGDQSLKNQAIQFLQSSVDSCTNLSTNGSLTCDTSSLSSSADQSSTTSSNILALCFDKPKTVTVTDDEVLLWLQSDFDTEIDDDDLLSFWKRKKTQFPTIAGIARKVLAIPAANTSVERLFSSTKNIIGDRRTRLGVEKIDKLMFLRKNYSSLKHMFDAKNGSSTAMSKRKIDDTCDTDDDEENDEYNSRKVKVVEENEYDLISDDYDSETEN